MTPPREDDAVTDDMELVLDEYTLNRARAERRQRIIRLVRPFQEFSRTEAASGVVILIAVALALIAANTPLSDPYQRLLHHHVGIDFGFFAVDEGLKEWIDETLMVIFFFVVGMEIKREIVYGELSGGRKVWVPVAAAIGGMVAPALVFFAIVTDADARQGWAIPMATDIAIAVGVMALLGSRVPAGLKVLLLALAIVDDIGAIAVIAIFYTADINFTALGMAAGGLGLIVAMNFFGIRLIPLYAAVAFGSWMAMHESGVHATLLGVVLGLLTPLQSWYRSNVFADIARALADRIRSADDIEDEMEAHERRVSSLLTLSNLSDGAVSPLDRIEHKLLPWSAFVVVPLFAFANAGVDLRGGAFADAASSSLALGVSLGLLAGKPLGVLAATWIAVRLGADLPAGVTWPGIAAIGLIAGIGFTVALFVTDLSYTDVQMLTQAKVGIFIASVTAALLGLIVLWRTSPAPPPRRTTPVSGPP